MITTLILMNLSPDQIVSLAYTATVATLLIIFAFIYMIVMKYIKNYDRGFKAGYEQRDKEEREKLTAEELKEMKKITQFFEGN